MNRVRIVALIAATVGVAVAAGTLFQAEPAQPAGLESGARAAPVPAPVPAEAPRALAEAGAPEAATAAAGAPAPASLPGGLMAASLLPGAVSGAEPPASPARPAEQGLSGGLSLLPETLPAAPAAPVRTAEAPVVMPIETDDALLAEIDSCAVWLVVTPAPGALLEASLFAPCDGGARIGIEHAGLRFDTRLGADGQLMANLPALRSEAVVSVRFEDGRSAEDMTEVPDFVLYDRFAVAWQGPEVVELNAYEFGSGFGGAGHVHVGNPGRPGLPARGFLTLLGDGDLEAPRLAQVYTFPSGVAAGTGEIALELEAHVAEVSCGMPLHVTLIEVIAGRAPGNRSVRFDMPECDGQGGFLVLKNLLPDMTLAAN